MAGEKPAYIPSRTVNIKPKVPVKPAYIPSRTVNIKPKITAENYPATTVPYRGKDTLAGFFPGHFLGATGTGMNPALGTALAALVAGGIGYGAGSLVDAVKDDPDSHAGRNWGIAGAALGAGLGVPWMLQNKWRGRPAYTPVVGSGIPDTPKYMPNPHRTPPLAKTNSAKDAAQGIFDRMVKSGNIFWPQQQYSVPVSSSMSAIYADPLLSPIEKAKLLSVFENADASGTGLVTPRRLAQAAVGAGLGYVGGTLASKVLSAFFGGLSGQTQRVLQGAGVFAGMLDNIV